MVIVDQILESEGVAASLEQNSQMAMSTCYPEYVYLSLLTQPVAHVDICDEGAHQAREIGWYDATLV